MRTTKRLLVTGATIAIAAGLAACGASAATTTRATGTPATQTAAPATTEPAPVTPSPKDFTLTVKTLTKQCFGEAGCNVTYRIEVGYSGPTLDPATTYDVTYEVRGVEDGPQVNTLTITGDNYSTDREEIASTSSAAIKLKAVVTDVAAQ
jgi:hypothetical protein